MKSNIEILEEQIELLTTTRDSLNNSISILENQLKVEKIKNCKGKLVYSGDLRDDYVYKCNKCENMKIFSLVPKNLKCKNNV